MILYYFSNEGTEFESDDIESCDNGSHDQNSHKNSKIKEADSCLLIFSFRCLQQQHLKIATNSACTLMIIMITNNNVSHILCISPLFDIIIAFTCITSN